MSSSANESGTLMLLPGLLCDDAVWRAQREALAEWRCVVPCYGALDSLEGMARHVLAVAPSERFSLAGHSMGGRVAMEVLRLAPERVERVALADTGCEPIAPGPDGAAERRKRLDLLETARTLGMRAMGREWARGMVHPDQLGTPLFDEILDMIERKTPEIFESQIRALIARPDARPVLAGIRCPTLLWCGRQDAWSPLERHVQMARLIPGARLVAIEDCGHMSTMERPAEVSAALRDWLNGR